MVRQAKMRAHNTETSAAWPLQQIWRKEHIHLNSTKQFDYSEKTPIQHLLRLKMNRKTQIQRVVVGQILFLRKKYWSGLWEQIRKGYVIVKLCEVEKVPNNNNPEEIQKPNVDKIQKASLTK